MDMLKICNLSKSFGSNRVIDNLNLNVEEHHIYGFIGKNGAGKTTTMKMILGLCPCDQGEIYVNGQKVMFGQNRTNQYIGYLPDVPEFYGYMTPQEYLKLCADITGIPDEMCKKRIPELLAMVGLTNHKKRIQGFSRGMKQRLGIAQALLGEPKLLICDEPTSALDPIGRKEILDILSEVGERTTILFSTHILSDVERICDQIGVLHKGRIALSGTMDEIHGLGHHEGFEMDFVNEKELKTFVEKYPGGERTGRVQMLYKGRDEKEMRKAMKAAADHSILVKRIEICEPSLESLFMEVIEK